MHKHGSNENITCDNWFMSIQLTDALKQRGLTSVGTVKKLKGFCLLKRDHKNPAYMVLQKTQRYCLLLPRR